MTHDEFVGQVQHRAQLPSRGDAEAIIRATLETLSERLQPEVAMHIAAQLPPEIGRHLCDAITFEHLNLREFYDRIALREHAPVEKSIFHTRAVVETLREAISPGAVKKLRQGLPDEFRNTLFKAPVAA